MLRWPALREALAGRAETNDEFASLCESYTEAHDALETWRRSDHSLAAARVVEYLEIVADIEGDVLEQLGPRQTGGLP
jgi:hypothetical protein